MPPFLEGSFAGGAREVGIIVVVVGVVVLVFPVAMVLGLSLVVVSSVAILFGLLLVVLVSLLVVLIAIGVLLFVVICHWFPLSVIRADKGWAWTPLVLASRIIRPTTPGLSGADVENIVPSGRMVQPSGGSWVQPPSGSGV